MRELKIQDVAFGGKGVARENGKAVFIPFTIDGERISARIVHEEKNFAEAELIELIEPSKNRVTPDCPYFGRCGGCSYQHIQYEHQLELKARQVEQTLRRIGRITDAPMQPIVPSPLSYGYRNRITVHCQGGAIGFYRRDEHRLIEVAKCPIATSQVNDELAALRARHPRDGHYTLRVHSAHRVFSQTNDAVAKRLLEHVASLIPERGVLLVDAYCGAGFFAKHLLEKFERIVGIDWDVHAIQAAKRDASAKETYISGDVEVQLKEVGAVHQIAGGGLDGRGGGQLRSIDPTFDAAQTTLIVDPPATGLSASVRKAVAHLAPDSFIYVSCNPAALARDLADFRERFTIDSVTPFDMFPQTAEIEVVVRLRARLS